MTPAVRSRFRLPAVLLAGALAACSGGGDDTTDPGGNDAGAGGATDAGGGAPDGGEATDGGTTPAAVTTATITLSGVTTTVVPNVRRGLVFMAPTATKTTSGTYGQALVFACAPDASHVAGGRTIAPTSVSIAGNIVGNCAQNLAQITSAENQLKTQIGSACGGKSTCSFDPTSAMDTYLAECSPQNLTVVVQFACRALDPAPSFVVESASPAVSVSGLDGLGTASCGDRAARFVVDGVAATLAEDEPCTISITRRTDRSLAGTITATIAGPSPRPLTVAFEHDRNTLRPAAGVHLGNDVCATNAVTHTTRTADGETWDDFTAGPLACQVRQPPAPVTLTFTRRRARAGSSLPQDAACGAGRLNVALSDAGSTANAGGECRSAFVVSESEEVLQLITQNLSLCPEGSSGGCATRPVVYLSVGLGGAAAPIP